MIPKINCPQNWSDLRSSVKNFSALRQKLLETGYWVAYKTIQGVLILSHVMCNVRERE